MLLCFTILGWVRHLRNTGEDLASSYVACRLMAAGDGDHLYRHSATNFSKVNDPAWDQMADQTGYAPLRLLHPYVQTPLWAFSLRPVCTRLNFKPFLDSYLLLFMLSLSGTLWLVARYWTPSLFHPAWIALVYLGLYRSEPFKYAIFLAQTHILYLFLTVLALILAERRRAGWAGVLLAFAAAVKITPGFLVLYWLATRRYKAVAYFLAASALLFLLNFPLVGASITRAYLASLAQNSDALLLAFNNQSLAAWWMGLHAPRSAVLQWTIYPLPQAVKALSVLLTVASCLLGGWMDSRAQEHAAEAGPPFRPAGAVFAMLGVTVFASVAWTHYFLLLVLPVMFFMQEFMERRSWVLLSAVAAIVLLNVYPISFGSVHFQYKSFTIIRSQFYAALFAMGVLVRLHFAQMAKTAAPVRQLVHSAA